MGWIILTALAILLAVPAVGYALYQRAIWPARVQRWEEGGKSSYDKPTSYELVAWGAAGLVVVLWVLLTGLFVFKTVGQREVAIVYSFSGTITGKRDPGVVTIAPWQHIRKENIGIQHNEWSFGQDNAAVSLDQQKVFANLAVNYQVDTEKVVDLYKRVGPAWKSIIVDARVPQVFKETTATYQTQEITAKREQLREQTRTRLQNELSPYDIKVVDVFVTNLGFSKGYSDAIEAKQKQVQDAQRQEAKIREAKAIGDQKVATAEREAKANVAIARGEATANRLRQKSLTPMLIQQQAIEKLNPQATVIFCPQNTVCIPNGSAVVTGGK